MPFTRKQAYQLQPGDVLAYDPRGSCPSVESRTVTGVQRIGPVVIIDFADDTATPPVDAAAWAEVEAASPTDASEPYPGAVTATSQGESP